MKPNPASESVTKTAICLVVFYAARWLLLNYYGQTYGGLFGGFVAIFDQDNFQLVICLIELATLVYAVTWMVLLWWLAFWIYYQFFTAAQVKTDSSHTDK